MKDRYAELQKAIHNRNEGQLLITSLPAKTSGSVDELEHSLEATKFLDEKECIAVFLAGKPLCFPREDRLIFAEPFYQKERMIIYGGGHVALPLVKFARIVGFYVIVIDDRSSFASSDRFPDADEVICAEFSRAIERIKPSKSDYHVIITRGHKHDTLCIRELMKYEESVYTGMIGSKRRTRIVLDQLADEGYNRERLFRICTPIGLSIGAVTTEEIGISVMAEIIQRKRLESKDNIAVDRSDGDDQVMECLAGMDRPCCLATIMETEGSVPRKAGAKMIIYPDTTILGSVGGGCVEADIIRKGAAMAGSNTYEIINVTLDDDVAMEEGMVCGGRVKILLEDLKTE